MRRSVWRARRPSPSSVGGLGLKKIKTRAGSPSLITSMARLLFSSASRKYWRSRRIFPCRRVQSARRCRVQRLARRRRSGLHRSPDWRRLDDHKNSKEIIKSELFATSGGRRTRRPHYFATQDRPPNRPNRLRHANSEEYAAAGWWLAAPARWRWRAPV